MKSAVLRTTGLLALTLLGVVLFYARFKNGQKTQHRVIRSVADDDGDEIDFDPMQYSFEDFTTYHNKPKILLGALEKVKKTVKTEECRMSNCFDFEVCRKNGFKVYIYPQQLRPSDVYSDILSSIKSSSYYTDNIDNACIKVLSLDTIDRDVLSVKNFVKELPRKLKTLPGWNNGQNHLVFNLYSGTWPDYNEDLSFDLGKAILAKASISFEKYRSGFDISLPLWTLTHPVKGTHRADFNLQKWPPTSKYLVSFKGKRYLNGVGSDTRNQLFYFNDDTDHNVVMLTTCKHGKEGEWRKLCGDDTECLRNCERDIAQYAKWDYQQLLHNSTFCLVPRGRRLGSFRFIEVMQQGCIPILMSNGWVVPFSEKIDWSRAALIWDERLLIEFKDYIAEIDAETISRMRQQAAWYYSTYFSSIDKIIQTTIEIIHDRVFPSHARSMQQWNTEPGALIVRPSQTPGTVHLKSRAPKPHDQVSQKATHFTAVVYATHAHGDHLTSLIKELFASEKCNQVVVLWACDFDMPDAEGLVNADVIPNGKVLNLVEDAKLIMSNKFKNRPKLYKNDCIFFINDDVNIIHEEVDFGFKAWTNFHSSLVGYKQMEYKTTAMNVTTEHDEIEEKLIYSIEKDLKSTYSMIDTCAMFVHQYYLEKFSQSTNGLVELINENNDCEQIALNMVVAEHTGQGPVLVTPKTVNMFKKLNAQQGALSRDESKYRPELDTCLVQVIEAMGGNFLKTQQFRLDPMLYKDRMNINHKRYQKMDTLKT